jgi:hypothetical protein
MNVSQALDALEAVASTVFLKDSPEAMIESVIPRD